MPKETPPTFAPIGRIVGAFGIQGEVKIDPLTDFWERFKKGSRLRLKGDWVTVEGYREHKGRPLLRLSGVKDATAAEALQWEYLEANVADRPELDEDEFFTADLIGLRVVSTDGRELGEIDDIIENPAHEILEVGEVLIPVVKEFITDIDLEEGVITVQLIPGMLPGED